MGQNYQAVVQGQNINPQEKRLIKARLGLPPRRTGVTGKGLTQRKKQEPRLQPESHYIQI